VFEPLEIVDEKRTAFHVLVGTSFEILFDSVGIKSAVGFPAFHVCEGLATVFTRLDPCRFPSLPGPFP
jgi:hypothetical protein